MQKLSCRASLASLPILVLAGVCPAKSATSELGAEYMQVTGTPYTTTVTAASQGETVAWVSTQSGDVTLWVANGPRYQPRQALKLTGDTGDVIDNLTLSPDGRWLAFARGPSDAPNGRAPNAGGLVNGLTDALWLVATDGGAPAMIAAGASDASFAPDSAHFVFVIGTQVFIGGVQSATPGFTIESPKLLFRDFGDIDSLAWSPAGDAVAFTSGRPGHGLVGVFRLGEDRVNYVAPSVHRDSDRAGS